MDNFKLKELEGIFSGRFLTKDQTKPSGTHLYLTPRHIKEGEIVSNKETDRFFDIHQVDGDQYDKYILKPGDIVISSIFPKRKIYQFQKSDPPCFIGNNWIVLRTKMNNYLSDYLEIDEFYKNFELQCERRLRGGVIPFLSLRELVEIEISKIPQEELQKKIQEERKHKIQKTELLDSVKKGKLEEGQKRFLNNLVEEHFQDPIIKLSKDHENSYLEFKSSLRKDLDQGGQIPESVIIHSVMKTIGGFCNTGGGDLLIGVSDKNEIVGIEVDEYNDLDEFLRSLTQQIENNTNPDVMNLPDVIDISTTKVENKTICRINVNPTPVNVLVKYKNKEIFFKRKGPMTVSLEGRELLEYIDQKKSMYD